MRKVIDIQLLIEKGYMMYLIILKNANGILKLEDISKLVTKSYSQVTRDIKKIEVLGLVETTVIPSKNKIVILKRKAYKELFLLDKRVRSNNVYNDTSLQKNFMKAYIYNFYNIEKHKELQLYLENRYFNSSSIIFKNRNRHIFDIFKSNNIYFYDYEEDIKVVRVIISYHKINKDNTEFLCRKLEQIYNLFYSIGLADIDIDATVVVYKEGNADYIIKNMDNYKTHTNYYGNNSFKKLIKLNFLGNIDFKFIENID